MNSKGHSNFNHSVWLGTLCLACACATPACGHQDLKPSLQDTERLLAWLREGGGWLDEERVAIQTTREVIGGPGGRGLFATTGIEEGCLLAWVPSSHIFTRQVQ